jgi:hypothetical protein
VQASQLPPGYGKEAVSAVARPALEVGGMMAGGATGAATPIPGGAAVGGALGLAGGKAAADLLDRGLGIKKPIPSLGAAVGETAGNLAEGASAELGNKALEAAGGAAWPAAKKAMTAVLGPSGDALEARLTRNAAVKAAQPLEVLARELPQGVQALADNVSELRKQALDAVPQIKNAHPLDVLARRLPGDVAELSKKVSDLSTEALKTLPESTDAAGGALPATVLTDSIQQARGELGNSISKSAQMARSTLDGYLERAQKLGPRISQYDLGQIIRDMDHDIDWESKDLTPQNQALEGIRSQVDGALKSVNPDYEAAMKPVADGTRLLKKAETLFQVKKAAGTGYAPSNATAAALKGAIQDTRVDSQDVLDALQKITGRDYLGDVQNSLAKQAYLDGSMPPDLDAALRQSNDQYAKTASLADQRQQLLDKAMQIFQLKPGAAGKGLQPGDTTVAALERAVGPDRMHSQDVLDALKEFTGRDYRQEAQDALTASKFVGGKPNGSRRVVAGGALGGYVGNLLGGGPGAAAGGAAGGLSGMYLDTQGHEVAGNIVDQLVRMSQGGLVPSGALRRAIAAAMTYGAERRADPGRPR